MPKGRLLILEDDSGVARIVDLIARSSGFEAQFVADAPEFLRVAEEWQPSHVALDLMIPEADGEEVLIEMARRRFAAEIIIISGMGERVLEAAMRTALRHGLNIIGVLAKPFPRVALTQLLVDPLSMPPGRKALDRLIALG